MDDAADLVQPQRAVGALDDPGDRSEGFARGGRDRPEKPVAEDRQPELAAEPESRTAAADDSNPADVDSVGARVGADLPVVEHGDPVLGIAEPDTPLRIFVGGAGGSIQKSVWSIALRPKAVLEIAQADVAEAQP